MRKRKGAKYAQDDNDCWLTRSRVQQGTWSASYPLLGAKPCHGVGVGEGGSKTWHLVSRVPRRDVLSFIWRYMTELLSEATPPLGNHFVFPIQEQPDYKTDGRRQSNPRGSRHRITERNDSREPWVTSEGWHQERFPWSLPLKLQPFLTAVAQRRIPCSMHKHIIYEVFQSVYELGHALDLFLPFSLNIVRNAFIFP